MTQQGKIVQRNLSELESDIIDLFRAEGARLVSMPEGFVFTIDANPQRLVSTFQQKDVCKKERTDRAADRMTERMTERVNGHGS